MFASKNFDVAFPNPLAVIHVHLNLIHKRVVELIHLNVRCIRPITRILANTLVSKKYDKSVYIDSFCVAHACV